MSQAVGGSTSAGSTAGAPAAGSVDAHLDDILEDTGTTLPGLFAASGATITVISAVDGGRITLHVGDTWSFTVTDSTLDLSGYENVALVVKRNARQVDVDALLYLRSDTGLQRIGGAAPAAAGNGTLSKTSTSFTALVALAETRSQLDALTARVLAASDDGGKTPGLFLLSPDSGAQPGMRVK